MGRPLTESGYLAPARDDAAIIEETVTMFVAINSTTGNPWIWFLDPFSPVGGGSR